MFPNRLCLLEDVAFEIMAVGDGGRLWVEVGVWYVPNAQCETQLEMGVVHHLKFPIFSSKRWLSC